MIWFGLLLFACGYGVRLLAERRALARSDPTRARAYRKRRLSVVFRATNHALNWAGRVGMVCGFVLMIVGLFADHDAPPPRPGDGATRPGAVQGERPR